MVRPKDRNNRAMLAAVSEQAGVNPLPADKYAPFRELVQLANSGVFANVQRLYQNLVPESLRTHLRPFIRRAKYWLA